MKYIKPTDFLSVRELQADYKRIEGEITDLLLTDASTRTAAELNDKLQQALNAATRYLAGVNDKFAKKELSTAFKEGKESVHEKPKLTAKEADAILSAQGFRYSEKAFAKHTYIELQTATENAGKGLKSRVNGIIEGLRKTGKDSVYNVQQAILKDLQQNGLMVVEYANGTKQTLDSYAAMAARSARIESKNIGSIGRALQAGTDLVIMTTMPQCCKLCGAYQDKVYSISGKDKRFPALFKTVLKSGYALPHPNCRHEFIPYFAEAEDPADLERMIKQSRIKYDSKGRLADVRTQTDIELYQAWQAGNRQRNAEYLEYERMKEYYAGREGEMPYKTLASFRTARRRDELSPAFKAWRYRRQDARQYERWAQILGKENMPKDVDSFQEIKYNKHKQAEFQFFQHYKYARESGDISALVDFNLYTKTKKAMQHKFVGQIAVNGTKISSISNHFLDRHFGTIYRKSKKDPKHEGVMIEEIESAIKNGIVCDIKTDAKGRKSQKIYIKGKVDITVNPDTGELIQCNKISK